jgi:glycosyltransferase involved in cell wall biosynthesis
MQLNYCEARGFLATNSQPSVRMSCFRCRSHQRKSRLTSQLTGLAAMGGGLVPVVSDLPSGIPEVVDNSNGFLVPINDAASYARGIVHLHEHRDELAAKSAAARHPIYFSPPMRVIRRLAMKFQH